MLVNGMRPGFEKGMTFAFPWTFKDFSGTERTLSPKVKVDYRDQFLGRLYSGLANTIALYQGADDPSNSHNGLQICIGTNPTAPAISDYRIASVASNTFVNPTVSVVTSADYVEYTIPLVANVNVTVYEIGLYATTITTADTRYGKGVLVSRDVFTPITFQAGDSYILKYRFSFA